MPNYSQFSRPDDYLRKSQNPATIVIATLATISFFLLAGTGSTSILRWLWFDPQFLPLRFWTLATWSLISVCGPACTLFSVIWCLWICGSLERSWGTRIFVVFFAAVSSIMALGEWVAVAITQIGPVMYGLTDALAAPTVAWCTINRRETVNLWGIIPVPAPVVGVLSVVSVWYYHGGTYRGLFALAGCAAAWWYVQHGCFALRSYAAPKMPFGGRNMPKPRLRMVDTENEHSENGGIWEKINPFKRYEAYKQRKSLEKLWERSMGPERHDKGQNR